MILSKVAAVREPPCIEVDDGHEQERNVQSVLNIESIFAVIMPKLHEKVGQKRSAHGIASDQEKTDNIFTHIKKDFQFHGGKKKRPRLHPCWYVEQANLFLQDGARGRHGMFHALATALSAHELPRLPS